MRGSAKIEKTKNKSKGTKIDKTRKREKGKQKGTEQQALSQKQRHNIGSRCPEQQKQKQKREQEQEQDGEEKEEAHRHAREEENIESPTKRINKGEQEGRKAQQVRGLFFAFLFILLIIGC